MVKPSSKRSPGPRGPILFRGETVGPTALGKIRGIIWHHPRISQEEVARRVCRVMGWRRPNGEFPVRSCRVFLARLERWGLLRLPPLRGTSGGKATSRRSSKPLDPRGAPAEFDRPPQGASGLFLRPIQAHEKKAWHAELDRHHYLGSPLLMGEALCYVVFFDGEAVALLGWTSATLKNTSRERFIGWDEKTKNRRLHFVVQNIRFLLLPAAKGIPHLATRVLGANLRRLSRDWQVAFSHPVLLAETFVDPSRFQGTCYKASNWIYVGRTSGWSKKGRRWVRNHQPKMVFVYPLHRHACRWLREETSPLEAGENMGKHKILDVEQLPLHGEGGLLEVLQAVSDPRKRRGIRHPLVSILATAVVAVLSGAKSLLGMAQIVENLPPEALKKLGCKREKPPSEPTLRRTLAKIDVDELDRKLGQWMAAHVDLLLGQGIAIDGKTIRGSKDHETLPFHLVSAVLHKEGLVLAQSRVSDKTNEMKCVKPLLEDLDIQGAVVTGDAMFTQKQVAEYLVDEKGADYLFTVKANQPTLLSDIEDLRLEAFPPSGGNLQQGARPPGDTSDLGE